MRLVQIFRRVLDRHGWLIMLLVISCWLTVWGTPVIARGHGITLSKWSHAMVSHPGVKQTGEQVKSGRGKPFLTQGSILFAAGRLTAAATAWQQAAQAYAAQGDLLDQARALHYLAMAYFNLGQWSLAQATNTASQSQLERAAGTDRALLGSILNLHGQLQEVLGQPEQGIETWKQAAATYALVEDTTGQLGAQLNQAKALQTLGYYRQSQSLLEQSLALLQTQSDSRLKATGLQLLGTTAQAMGDLPRSQSLLTASLAMSQELATTQPVFADQVSTTLIALGNTLALGDNTETALAHYQQAANRAIKPLTRVEAQLSQLQLLIKTEQWEPVQQLITQLPPQLKALPPGRDTVYAQVNFAASWIRTLQALPLTTSLTTPLTTQSQQQPQRPSLSVQRTEIAQLLANAVKTARSLSDMRAEAFALGQLGHLYESAHQWSEAQKLTQQAMELAVNLNAPDLQTTWQWQLGRILKQQGELEAAIAAYDHAVESLQSLRQELIALNPDLQFSFLETVEPVYRELVSLLLDNQPNQGQLHRVRQLIESLQLAELDNFFHHACLQATPQLIDTLDVTAAVLYPIILPDRLAVIVSRPGQPLLHYETQLPQAIIEDTIAQLQLYLNPHFFEADRLAISQQLYDWLIRPAEEFLEETQTLVFVLDGPLRNLPMAALHDGTQYLIERYSVALNPGLQLIAPQSFNMHQIDVLTGGLSASHQGFSALPAVDTEINQIAAILPTTQLLNQTFTTAQLKDTLRETPFSVVHLATHGQFSSKAEDTFLVTWDSHINVQDLDDLLRPIGRYLQQPLELLVLSACQTATGDRRAALGLAGMALRSGARSTLATLWQVNDDSTATLMVEFYQQLIAHPEITKATALRAAQLHLLKQPQYQQPFYWAPFVLVGNWL